MIRKTVVVTLIVLLSITGAMAAVRNIALEADLTADSNHGSFGYAKLIDGSVGYMKTMYGVGGGGAWYTRNQQIDWDLGFYSGSGTYWSWDSWMEISQIKVYVQNPPQGVANAKCVAIWYKDHSENLTRLRYFKDVEWSAAGADISGSLVLNVDILAMNDGLPLLTDYLVIDFGNYSSGWNQIGEIRIFGDDLSDNPRRNLSYEAALSADSNYNPWPVTNLRDDKVGYAKEHCGQTSAGPQYYRNYNDIAFYCGSGTYWEWDDPKHIDTVLLFVDPNYADVKLPMGVAVWYRDQNGTDKRVFIKTREDLTAAWQPSNSILGSHYIEISGLDIVTDRIIVDHGHSSVWDRLGEVKIIGNAGEWQTVETAETLADARKYGFLTQCNITDAIVTFEREYSWGAFYVEDSDRTVGMCVLDPGGVVQNVQPGDRVTIIGETKPNFNGEKQIHATSVIKTGSGDVLTAVGMPNIKLAGADFMYDSGTGSGQPGVPGGTGLNTMGLYVKTWGKIVKWEQDDPDLQMIHISDGSGTDLEPSLIVMTPAYTYNDEYPVGSYVAVTGINSRTNYGGYYRAILQASSIEILAPAQ